MDRRSFFARLVPAATIASRPVVIPAFTLLVDGPLRFGDVHCPRCLCTQPYPIRSQFQTTAAYVVHVTSPQHMQCYNPECDWEGTVTFARRG